MDACVIASEKPSKADGLSGMRLSEIRSYYGGSRDGLEDKYDICIPESTDTISIDNIVAHELGHLFYVMNCLYGKNVPDLAKDGCLADKMADVIGIFTMSNRAEFYNNKALTTCHNDFPGVVHDFEKMGKGRRCSKNPLDGTDR